MAVLTGREHSRTHKETDKLSGDKLTREQSYSETGRCGALGWAIQTGVRFVLNLGLRM